ncbi:MAG: hypothetical protein ACXAE3_13610 [Candidatus Kariarchaeaceae archaeon]
MMEDKDFSEFLSLPLETQLAEIVHLTPQQFEMILESDHKIGLRTAALLNHYDEHLAFSVLQELGYRLTFLRLFNPISELSLLEDLHHQLFDRVRGSVDTVAGFYSNYGTTPMDFTRSLITSLQSQLIISGVNLETEHLIRLYEAILPSIAEISFFDEFTDNLDSRWLPITVPMKKHLTLLHLHYYAIDDPSQSFMHLQQLNYPFSQRLRPRADLGFDDLYTLLRYDLIQDKTSVLSEITDQEHLILLFHLDTLRHEQSLITAKMNYDTIVRVLKESEVSDIIHHITSQEVLHRLFYDIESGPSRAIIAKLLKNNELAFEVLQHYFDTDADYLDDDLINELFVLLKLKQLALLRLSLPNEYHSIVMRMVEEKEKRERNDSSFFA